MWNILPSKLVLTFFHILKSIREMYSFKLIAILTACVSIVAAGGDVEFCTEEDLGGHCVTLSYLDDECINFGSGLQDQVESVDPVGSGHNCVLYEDFDCEGDTFGFTEHHNSLGDFNDIASSFKCSS